jgi:hypothetical protein
MLGISSATCHGKNSKKSTTDWVSRQGAVFVTMVAHFFIAMEIFRSS